MAELGDDLIDYEEDDEVLLPNKKADSVVAAAATKQAGAEPKEASGKKGYVGIHSTGFRDFLLKPELLRAISDCGFEHPSEGLSP